MTVVAVANRGFNLLGAALLGMGGLLFGAVVFQEQDLSDKVDDGGFLLLAGAAIVLYVWRDNRFRRTIAPVLVAAVAVLVQIAGFVLERDDPKAFGDNIGGLLYFAAALLLLVSQYRATGRLSSSPRRLEAPHL